jgi:hypothetical protein
LTRQRFLAAEAKISKQKMKEADEEETRWCQMQSSNAETEAMQKDINMRMRREDENILTVAVERGGMDANGRAEGQRNGTGA